MGIGSGVTENDYFDVKVSVAISLLAWPTTYFVETGIMNVDEDVNLSVVAESNAILLTVQFLLTETDTSHDEHRFCCINRNHFCCQKFE